MELPNTGSREEWLAARLELLAKEKELSRAQAAVAAERRALPMVEITQDYVFTGPGGQARLADLFEGRSQLIIYHFMWLHPIGQGCPSCSFSADNMPDPVHLNKGTAPADSDAHGLSVFVRDGDRVFHTYSTYAAGADVILSTYRLLDLTPLGRQRYVTEWPWHDTYDDATPATLATIMAGG
jgi:predicted dithiol-disulfide oxidoreductase (DUF899 family)